MREIPREKTLDSTPAFLRDGYRFVSNRSAKHDSDVFRVRLMAHDTVCVYGDDAARAFYDTRHVQRQGAAPFVLTKTLVGEGGVQALDGEAHEHRKALFLSLMTPSGIESLVAQTRHEWLGAARRWSARDEVVLFDALMQVLFRAACGWAGVPYDDAEVEERTEQMGDMIEGPGSAGPRLIEGMGARKRAEKWMMNHVKAARAGELSPPMDSALSRFCRYEGPDGERLDAHDAAVELLNVIRPTVAVARYLVFVAHALHCHPEEAEKVRNGDDGHIERLVQEVRRFYPFFPAVVGKVHTGFELHGFRIEAGTRLLLDLYATNHDPRIWSDPEAFRPDRFLDWDGSAYGFVPQGGGRHDVHHRCAGEWLTIALMKYAACVFTRELFYEVPEQDLSIDLGRVPTLPKDRFRISGVTLVN